MALIAGPTASGKSALALALAERTGGIIINADSAQIYRGLPILSAAPSAEERQRAEHRLYGIRDPADPCSAADWAALAKVEISDVHKSSRLPILVGGTGLYIRTLLNGIAPVPAIDPAVRAEVRAAAVADNRKRLEALDPATAERLAPGDTLRTARALEVALSTGMPLSHWQQRREGGILPDIALRPLVLLPPRNWLYERCDERFARMMDGGAAVEVARLLALGLSPHLPVMRAIGVAEIEAMLRGEISRDEALARGRQATRRYAKRQYTWFAHQPPPDWPRFVSSLDDGMADALALLEASA